MPFLINTYIKQNSKRDVVLDFEGSKDEDVARFYKGFGAGNKEYYNKKRKLFWDGFIQEYYL